ncbi:MAG TPA: hypothetical protein PK431_02115 [Chitinophagales bacterium]|nr:hypothetical protein [Chitinophagales bacterium]
MKKLSLLIAVGSFVFLSIAKPTTNATTFDSYSQQMQAMASKYVAEQKFENANKALSKWLDTYNALSATEKENYKTVYANIMIEEAKALTQINQHYDALVCLKNAVKNGYSNAELLTTDSNLSALKTYSEFDKIIKSIK